MRFPHRILPNPDYKFIDCDLSNHFLARFFETDNVDDIKDPDTGFIRQKYICQAEHASDLSTNLLGIFRIPYLQIELTRESKKKYNHSCEPDCKIDIPTKQDY